MVRCGPGLIRTFGADDKAHAEPFDAVELDLTMIWGQDHNPEEPDVPEFP